MKKTVKKVKKTVKKVQKSDNKVTNILLSGVGGQGAILASNILAHVFVQAGYDVKKSEVHGMAQRGGDVTTHFRFGKKVYSPLIKYGDVDYLLAFELLEALRYINYCKDEAKIVINDQKILPPAVNLGQAKYPDNVPETFKKFFKDDVHIIKGNDTAANLEIFKLQTLLWLERFQPFSRK